MIEDIEEALRLACARIEYAGSQGTGYLVTDSIVATAGHVIDEWEAGEKLKVIFDAHRDYDPEEIDGEVLSRSKKDDADAALVKLDRPVQHHKPIRLVSKATRHTPWMAVGYPAYVESDDVKRIGTTPIPADGQVSAVLGTDPERRNALILFCKQAAAGLGGRLHGMSGSPVAAAEGVIGHLYRIVPDPEEETVASLGMVYACESRWVLELLEGKNIPLEDTLETTPELEVVELRAVVPDLLEYRFHAWVRCTGSDNLKRLTRELCNRLESYSLRVNVDTESLPKSAEKKRRRDEHLDQCRGAVLIGSAELSDRKEWHDEREALLSRASSSGVVGAWFGDAEPPEADGLAWVCFPDGVSGSAVEQLGMALIGHPLPADETPVFKAQSSHALVQDAAMEQLRRASKKGANSLLETYNRILGVDEEGGSETSLLGHAHGLTLLTAQELLSLGGKEAADAALGLLEGKEVDGPQALKLRAQALAETDKLPDAIELLEEQRGELDVETTNLLRRLRGERAKKTLGPPPSPRESIARRTWTWIQRHRGVLWLPGIVIGVGLLWYFGNRSERVRQGVTENARTLALSIGVRDADKVLELCSYPFFYDQQEFKAPLHFREHLERAFGLSRPDEYDLNLSPELRRVAIFARHVGELVGKDGFNPDTGFGIDVTLNPNREEQSERPKGVSPPPSGLEGEDPIRAITWPSGFDAVKSVMFFTEDDHVVRLRGISMIGAQVPSGPLAVIAGIPKEPVVPVDALLDARESKDPEGGGVSYSWFLDGELQNAQNPQQASLKLDLRDPGGYEVRLLVEDAEGNKDETSERLDVQAMTLLWVSDEHSDSRARAVQQAIENTRRVEIVTVESTRQALAELETGQFEAVLTDERRESEGDREFLMPGETAADAWRGLLRRVRSDELDRTHTGRSVVLILWTDTDQRRSDEHQDIKFLSYLGTNRAERLLELLELN